MKVQYILVLGSTILLLIGFAMFPQWNKDYFILSNVNELKVSAMDSLSHEKVRIGIKLYDESNHLNERYTRVFDAEQILEIPNFGGKNRWFITYNEEYYTAFTHTKSKGYHQHEYGFHFYEHEGNIMVIVLIMGKDDARFETQMVPMKQE